MSTVEEESAAETARAEPRLTRSEKAECDRLEEEAKQSLALVPRHMKSLTNAVQSLIDRPARSKVGGCNTKVAALQATLDKVGLIINKVYKFKPQLAGEADKELLSMQDDLKLNLLAYNQPPNIQSSKHILLAQS